MPDDAGSEVAFKTSRGAEAQQGSGRRAARFSFGGSKRKRKATKTRRSKRSRRAVDEGAPEAGIEILPVSPEAVFRRRHWGVLTSFVAVVVLPLVLAAAYLFFISADQYASTVGFTVRKEEAPSPSDLIGGLAQFSGVSGSSESDILYEFIQSQEIVAAVNERIDLMGLYSKHWPSDPLFALSPDSSIEDLLSYWRRMVRISYDQSTRLIELRVLGFTSEDAQLIASEIVAESQRMINGLNDSSRQDVLRYTNEDLDIALKRLKAAREALTEFRTRTQIVDPESDIQARMGVMTNLQQELAAALIDNDLLLQQTENPNDPRLAQSKRRVDVIRERIADERKTFASASNEIGDPTEDYPKMIAEYESLTVDREYAEESYRLALAAADASRAEASRQTLYLAAYVKPTLSETSEFPQRFTLIGLAALFLFLVWSIIVLAYYSVRDRR